MTVTAASVAEALSRYLGEGAPHTLTSLSAATAFLAPDAVRGPGDPGEDSLDAPDLTFDGVDPAADPEATQAAPAPSLGPRRHRRRPGAPAPTPTRATRATQAAPSSATRRRRDPARRPGAIAGCAGACRHDLAAPRRPLRAGRGRPAEPTPPLHRAALPASRGWGWAPAPCPPTGAPTTTTPVRCRSTRSARERPGSSWMRLGAALVGLLLLVLTLVVVANLGGPDLVPGGESSDEPSAESSAEPDPPQPVQVASIADFDPERTAAPRRRTPTCCPWRSTASPRPPGRPRPTSTGRPLAPYKSGVGLLLDLGQETEVTDVVDAPAREPLHRRAAGRPGGRRARPTAARGWTASRRETGVGGRVVLRPTPRSPPATSWCG